MQAMAALLKFPTTQLYICNPCESLRRHFKYSKKVSNILLTRAFTAFGAVGCVSGKETLHSAHRDFRGFQGKGVSCVLLSES